MAIYVSIRHVGSVDFTIGKATGIANDIAISAIVDTVVMTIRSVVISLTLGHVRRRHVVSVLVR